MGRGLDFIIQRFGKANAGDLKPQLLIKRMGNGPALAAVNNHRQGPLALQPIFDGAYQRCADSPISPGTIND